MKEQHRIWQNEWRRIMGKAINVDVEPACDFDLHFDIWTLEKGPFFELFDRFPRGTEIAENAYRLKWGELGMLNEPLSSEALMDEVRQTIGMLQQISPMDELNHPKITFQRGDDKRRLDLLSQADPLSINVDDAFSTLVWEATGEEGYNAYFFLREPMYRLASSYTPAHWILWCLTNLKNTNPYTPLLKLAYNRCDAALTNAGVLLYQLIEEERRAPGHA